MSQMIFLTEDGKKIIADMETDVRLYKSPVNPPNTGTRYTRGTDLYAHTTKNGSNYFYIYSWSMWQGEESRVSLISTDDAQAFIADRTSAQGPTLLNQDEIATALLFFPDLFEEDA